MEYRKKSCSMLLSNYATVSDKAFALLSLENNFETWMDMGHTGSTKTPLCHANILMVESLNAKMQDLSIIKAGLTKDFVGSRSFLIW